MELDETHVTVQGTPVPKVGYGTWQVTGQKAYDGVLDALALGYRHIDTAKMYGNEAEVGRAIADSGLPRDELWVTTKVWVDDADAAGVRRSTERSLELLGLDRLDLQLLHWPAPQVPLAETVGALAGLVDAGLARHIGVSNFPSAMLREACALGPVFCNQVEYHAYLPQDAVIAACREHDVLLTAYSPLAHGALLHDVVLTEVAEAHGRTVGQVALRWLLDQPGVAVIPKASTHARRAENLDVLGFTLTDEQRARIDALAERRLRTADPRGIAPVWD